MNLDPRHLFLIALAIKAHDEWNIKLSYADTQKYLASSSFGACGNAHGLGSCLSATYRDAKKYFGLTVAQKVANTFVGSDGKFPYDKY